MKRSFCAIALVGLVAFAGAACGDTGKGGKIDGKKEFEEHCAVCHPGGGNTINSAKTLDKRTREANGVKNVKDIIGKMRKPGPGMSTFDKRAIPDNEAKAIADYVVKTFK